MDVPIESFAHKYLVYVDYELSIAQLIASGRYDEVATEATSGALPIIADSGEAALMMIVSEFCTEVTTRQVIEHMKQQGRRPATLKEVLALGSQYPKLQEHSLVACLGTLFPSPHGYRALCLDSKPAIGRMIRCCWTEEWAEWLRGSVFPSVRSPGPLLY